MDAEEAIKAEARLAAIEYMLCRIYNMFLAHSSLSLAEDEIAILEESGGLSGMDLQATRIADPAMSDHIDDEIRRAQRRLYNLSKVLREKGLV